VSAALCCLGLAREATAVELGYAVHAEGAAARMVGERKVDQFGWGAAGLVAPELTIGDYLGLELPLGALGLSDGTVDEAGMADSGSGTAIVATPGVRLRPFGRGPAAELFSAGGLWLAASAGVAFTGGFVRPAFAARLGYDLTVGEGGEGRLGPYAGFMQIVETESEAMPEDARIVLVGLHGAFEPATAADGSSTPAQAPAAPAMSDRDHDGIPDSLDQCPDDPEDFDGVEDEDGCPDRDSDVEGIATIADRCPNDREHAGEGKISDGCPHEEHARVVDNEIVLDDRVYFRLNSADVEFRSWALLESVSKLLLAQPQYALVRVQGHADDTGDAAYNQGLSVRRAEAVRAMLIRFGVAAERLTVEGFGQSRPADPAREELARRKNRRVEFLILERRSIADEPISRSDRPNDARPSELMADGAPTALGAAPTVRTALAQRSSAATKEARRD
jgi:outer membrane protein OmpA-like peptidoglycan-associated protein